MPSPGEFIADGDFNEIELSNIQVFPMVDKSKMR